MARERDPETFKNFLREVSKTYRSFSEFEDYVDSLPDGEEKTYLTSARTFMKGKIAKLDRFYTLSPALIEEIVTTAA